MLKVLHGTLRLITASIVDRLDDIDRSARRKARRDVKSHLIVVGRARLVHDKAVVEK